MKNRFVQFLSDVWNGSKVNGAEVHAENPVKSQPEINVKAANIEDYAYFNSAGAILYADKKERYVNEGFIRNDMCYSIIRLITNKVKVPSWAWYTVEDEKAYTDYCTLLKAMSTTDYEKAYGDSAAHHIRKDYVKMMGYKNKAMKPYNPTDVRGGRLKELITYPNAEQTWNDLLEEGCGFKLITGDKFKYAELSEAPLTAGLPMSIDNLASQHMIIISDRSRIPIRAASYKYQCGVIVNYDKEEIMHEKYYNPKWDAAGTQLYGMSPIQAAWRRIQRSNEALKAGIASFTNGGSDGYMSPKTEKFAEQLIDLEWSDLDETKARVKYAIGGGSERKGDIAILNSPWDFTRLRLSPVDLNIIESERWDLPMLCNVWGVPSQLLNDPANKVQANAVSGEKALTLRCALPMLIDERDNMNRKFHTDWGLKGKKIVMDFDATVFTELEEDKKSQTEWLKDAYWYTPNQKLQIQGEATSNDPNMDRIWLPSNLIPMDDASTQQIDTDEFLNT